MPWVWGQPHSLHCESWSLCSVGIKLLGRERDRDRHRETEMRARERERVVMGLDYGFQLSETQTPSCPSCTNWRYLRNNFFQQIPALGQASSNCVSVMRIPWIPMRPNPPSPNIYGAPTRYNMVWLLFVALREAVGGDASGRYGRDRTLMSGLGSSALVRKRKEVKREREGIPFIALPLRTPQSWLSPSFLPNILSHLMGDLHPWSSSEH